MEKKTTTRKKTTSTKKTVAKSTNQEEKEIVKKKSNPPRDLYVKIISNYDGKIVYQSPNQQVYFELNEYGSSDFVELSTLMQMRNANIRFFKENWILLDDTDNYTADELYEYLRIKQYYNNIYTPNNIDKLFKLTAKKIKEIVSNYPQSLKETIFAIAKEQKIDSVTKKKALEDATGLKFEE